MNDHFLKMHFNGWSNEALEDRKMEIIRFNESKLELKMIERELERRRRLRKLPSNIVSTCCNATVQDGLKIAFPYGNRHAVHFNIRYCDSCGLECDEVHACEVCGVVGCGGDCE